MNNIHPAVAANHADVPRSRHSASYTAHTGPPIENGLPTESSQTFPAGGHSHRTSATNPPQRSPTVRYVNLSRWIVLYCILICFVFVRHSTSSNAYPNGGLIRQNADTSSRSATSARSQQPYTLYQTQGSTSGSQQVGSVSIKIK